MSADERAAEWEGLRELIVEVPDRQGRVLQVLLDGHGTFPEMAAATRLSVPEVVQAFAALHARVRKLGERSSKGTTSNGLGSARRD